VIRELVWIVPGVKIVRACGQDFAPLCDVLSQSVDDENNVRASICKLKDMISSGIDSVCLGSDDNFLVDLVELLKSSW
jgi:hypothetical protein